MPSISAYEKSLPFCDYRPCSSTTRFGNDAAVFIVLCEWGNLVAESCIKTTQLYGNLRDLSGYYSPKQQLLSKSFPKALLVCVLEQWFSKVSDRCAATILDIILLQIEENCNTNNSGRNGNVEMVRTRSTQGG
jgi:hypothetical protein